MLYYLITIPLTFFIICFLLQNSKDKKDGFIMFYYPVVIPIFGDIVNHFIYSDTTGGFCCWFICNICLLLWWVAPYLIFAKIFVKKDALEEGAAFGIIAIVLINIYAILSF